MSPNVKTGSGTLLLVLFVFGAAQVIYWIVRSIKEAWELGVSVRAIWGLDMFSPDVILFSTAVAVAGVVYKSDSWWPWVRRKAGLPDALPALQFHWPNQGNPLIFLDGASHTDICVIVRNPSTTTAIHGVQVVMDWHMSARARRSGALPSRNEKRLKLHFEDAFEAIIEPEGRRYFRLCRAQDDGSGGNDLLVATETEPLDWFHKSDVALFQVRAIAPSARTAWDCFEVDVSQPNTIVAHRRTAEVVDYEKEGRLCL